MKKLILFFLFALSSAVTFAFSGSGTEADPYLVKTADDLYAMRNNPGACYKMTNDIDLTQWIAENYPEAGWAPICASANPFGGIFDGNGFTISGLYINRTTSFNGLFGQADGATIKNLNIVCDITGVSYTAAIIGYGKSVTLTNCTVCGSVEGDGGTGGIIGEGSQLTLKCCAMNGSVIGRGDNVGGLIGYLGRGVAVTSITKCYVKGDVTSIGGICNNIGGLIGFDDGYYAKDYYSKISDCCYEGNVTAKGDYVGGISGRATGRYQRCLVKGTVSGRNFVGGMTGSIEGGNNYATFITSCVVICSEIRASSDVGRIYGFYRYIVGVGDVGKGTENKASVDSKVYVGTTLQETSDGDQHGYAAGAALKRAITYTNLGWDFTDVWDIDEGEGYPYLRFRQAMGGSVSMEDETTFNFTSPTTLTPRVTPSSDEDTGVNITTKTFTSDDVTLSFGLGTRTQTFCARLWTNDDKSYGLRIYKDGTMTIATIADNMITSIAFTGDDVSAMTCSEGSISGGIWTGEAQSVTFTIGASYNRISRIDVTYKHTVLVLSDAIPTVRPGIFEPGKVKYGRVVTGDYASFCLPFDVDLNEVEGIAKVYMPMEQILYNTKTQYLMMFLKEQDMTSTIKAGTPFLAKLNDNEVSFCNAKRVSYGAPYSANPTAKSLTVFDFDGQSGVLYENNTLNVSWGGTYVPTAATTGFNSFNINGSFGQHSGTLSPYRAYVMQTAKGGSSNVRGIQLNLGNDEGEVTSVFQLLSEPATTEGIYDMQGRRVFDAQPGGLYIINGKKVVK